MTRHSTLPPSDASNLKLGLAVTLAVAFIGVVIVAAKPGATGAGAAPRIEAQANRTQESASQPTRMLAAREASFDFGSISMAAGKVQHKYWIRNTGDAPITIRKMYTSCMCTTAALVKAGRRSAPAGMPGHGPIPDLDEPIAPSEAAMVEVVFDPAAHGPGGIGRVERVVTIQTDREQPLELAFVATVTP